MELITIVLTIMTLNIHVTRLCMEIRDQVSPSGAYKA